MKNSDKIKLRGAIKKLQKQTTSSNDCVSNVNSSNNDSAQLVVSRIRKTPTDKNVKNVKNISKKNNATGQNGSELPFECDDCGNTLEECKLYYCVKCYSKNENDNTIKYYCQEHLVSRHLAHKNCQDHAQDAINCLYDLELASHDDINSSGNSMIRELTLDVALAKKHKADGLIAVQNALNLYLKNRRDNPLVKGQKSAMMLVQASAFTVMQLLAGYR